MSLYSLLLKSANTTQIVLENHWLFSYIVYEWYSNTNLSFIVCTHNIITIATSCLNADKALERKTFRRSVELGN